MHSAALAGDDYTFSQTFVFSNEDSGNALVYRIDESNVKSKALPPVAGNRWETKTGNKSEGNHVYTVDNIPVLDLTAKYGGIENVTPENQNLLIEIAANSLQLQREKETPSCAPGWWWIERPFLLYQWRCAAGFQSTFLLPPDFDVMEKVVKRR